VKGNIALANQLPGVAELDYLQALGQDEPNSAGAAFTMETYAKFLTEQSRTAEAEAMRAQALPIRQARVAAISARATSEPAASGFALRPLASADTEAPSEHVARAIGADPVRVGNGVSAPVLLHKQEPQYSEEARSAKYQGTVMLYVVISPEGRATNLKLIKGLGFGLDEKAAEAVMQWQFAPGKRDGAPVSVEATIEVNFRLL
jgi:TonB family protein